MTDQRKAGQRGAILEPLEDKPLIPWARDYLTAIPTPPAQFDNAANVKGGFPMALNDSQPDCTVAGWWHLLQILYAMCDAELEYPGDDVIETTFTDLGGGPNTGLELTAILDAAIKTGLFGERIFGYMAVDIHDHPLLGQAAYAYGGLYGGFAMPSDSEEQFENHQPFHVDTFPKRPQDGHCMIISGANPRGLPLETWGSETSCTWQWWARYGQQAFIVIPQIWVDRSFTPIQGVNLSQLEADMQLIGKAN